MFAFVQFNFWVLENGSHPAVEEPLAYVTHVMAPFHALLFEMHLLRKSPESAVFFTLLQKHQTEMQILEIGILAICHKGQFNEY